MGDQPKICNICTLSSWKANVSVRYCCVNECKNNDTFCNVSLYKFPRNVETRQKWIDFVNREEGWVPNSGLFICSAHFGEAKNSLVMYETRSNKNKKFVIYINIPHLRLYTMYCMTVIGKCTWAEIIWCGFQPMRCLFLILLSLP